MGTHILSSERSGQVRRPEENELARGTHVLSCARHKSGHRKRASERGVLTSWNAEEGQVRTPKNASGRGALTSCRAQMIGQLRTPRERRGTHYLETPSEGEIRIHQKKASKLGHSHPARHSGRDNSGDRERERASHGHSPPGARRGKDNSGP